MGRTKIMTQRMLVLVVEDEPTLLDLTADMLSELGFETITAPDATRALAIIESADVDLLLTDVRMPGEMDGIALAEVVNASWPSIKVVCVSGYSPDPKRLASVCVNFLGKPFTIDQLE